MKFYSREKQPKVWSIAIIAVSTIVIGMVMWLIGGDAWGGHISLLIDIALVAIAVILFIAFRKQLEYDPYSYNTIYYIGFALLVCSMILTNVWLTVMMYRSGVEYQIQNIPYVIANAAQNYMLYTSPLILIFSIALCISNISLILHEGFRGVNLLGIILSLLLIGGALLLWRINYYTSGSLLEVMIHDIWANLLAAVYIYYECMLVGTMIAGAVAARHEPQPDKSHIIILGCAIRSDGTPTPLLRGRIDRALDFARRQKEKTGKDVYFVPSGGQGPNEVVSESACMKQYLMEQGVPEAQIIEENQSTTTFENMKFSKEKIQAQGEESKIAFSTTQYHVFRSGIISSGLDMKAVGMGAKTKWYFWPNAAVREFVSLLTQHRIKQIVIFAVMAAIIVAMTILNYQY